MALNDDFRRMAKESNRLNKAMLTIAGTFFLGLGITGIVLPVLPTTPFLLLAAVCYSRGSNRFYNWLTHNKLFGKYIRDYRRGKGISIRAKVFTISLLWATII